MDLVCTTSLAATVDAVSAALFHGEQLSLREREAAARFIAARQGHPGGYRGLFAALESEPRNELRLFTGERVTCASARHILGQEAYRAMLQLGVDTREVRETLMRASAQVGALLKEPNSRGPGMYCCGKCSVSVWRAVLAGGYGGDRGYVAAGVSTLSTHRDGRGRWRVFPFWYTVLALAEVEGRGALDELRYAAPVLERVVKRQPAAGLYPTRRRMLAERALGRC